MFTYTTKLRIQPSVIAEELETLRGNYEAADPTGNLRKTRKADNIYGAEEARTAFSRWNNLRAFYERLTHQSAPAEWIPWVEQRPDGSVVIDMVGSATGNSARVYFHPSVTSLTKEVRKAIMPLDDSKVFVYADLRAAEFALRCVQAGETDAIDAYSKGEDIYMHYADVFPVGTPRSSIKTTLIANMYGATAYSTGKRIGISDAQADNLLRLAESRTPRLTLLKRSITNYCRRNHGYFSPTDISSREIVKVADIKGEMNPNLAWSAWTQSCLGFMMQKFTTEYGKHQVGCDATYISIFDSFVAEISLENLDRYKKFFCDFWNPLLPDDFTTGKTMYQAMYQ